MIKEITATSRSGIFKVRIENGLFLEIVSLGDQKMKKQTIRRGEDDSTIRWWFNMICTDDSESFKEILQNIKDDEEFFHYGKLALKDARIIWEKRLQVHKEEVEKKMEEMRKTTQRLQEKVKEYTWSE